MKVSFWGVRGSIPTSGPATARYGGHTSCVLVRADDSPPLVFDLGTGARLLGKALLESAIDRVYVALSHTHMDHLIGLPYFDPIFHPNCRVHLGVPAESSADARRRVGQYLNGIFHPLRLDDIGGRLKFHGVPAGSTFNVGPYLLQTLRLVHPGGTLGYRASFNGRSVCYLTDTGPLAQPGQGLMGGNPPTQMEEELLKLVDGTDLMVMDTTFEQDEYHQKLSWGHAYPEYAVQVAKMASVKTVVLFHHSPDATDDMLDGVSARWADHEAPTVMLAKEGLVLDLEG